LVALICIRSDNYFSMTENIQKWVGEFNLFPGKEGSPLMRGYLEYNPNDKISLHIADKSALYSNTRDSREYSIIHGTLEGYMLITLIACFDKNVSWNTHGFEQRLIHVNWLIKGAHLSSINEPSFYKLDLRHPALTSWYNSGLFKSNYKAGESKKFIYEYEQPVPYKFSIPDIGDFVLWVGGSFPAGLSNAFKAEIKEWVGIQISFHSPKSWSEVRKIYESLIHFFSMAANIYAGKPDIRVAMSREEVRFPEILYCVKWHNEPFAVMPRYMNFLFTHIKDRCEECFTKWFNNIELFSPLFDLYGSVKFSQMGVPASFLFMIQAIEGLQRKTIGGSAIEGNIFSNDILPKLKEAIPESISDLDRELLSKKLETLNEITLVKRIKSLCKLLPKVKGFFEDYKRDALEIKNIRNLYSHALQESKHFESEVADIQKMSYYIEFMEILFELSVLRLIGLGEEEITKIIKHSPKYRENYLYRKNIVGYL